MCRELGLGYLHAAMQTHHFNPPPLPPGGSNSTVNGVVKLEEARSEDIEEQLEGAEIFL